MVPKVKVEKIIKAEKDKVFSTITDFENLPSKLPQIFKSIKIISRDGNSIITEEFVRMAGRDITQKVKHVIQPTEKHEVFILEGDAKEDTEEKNQKVIELWKDYTAALVRWKLTFDLWQEAGNEAFVKYNQALPTFGANAELPQRLAKELKEKWMNAGNVEIKRFGKEWQNMLKESGLQSILKYDKDWEKFWSTSWIDPSKNYLEVMRQFTETWQNMWKK